MRIPCPFCGERSSAEFSYRGDAAPVRPARVDAPKGAAALRDFTDYVYLRDNPPGLLREWWQHSQGCRAWVAVERHVTTHAVGAVAVAPALKGATR